MKVSAVLPGRGAVKLPLFFTRQVLYGSIYFTAIVLVLFPLSIVTYLNFYKTLVPTERIKVPTRFLYDETSITGAKATVVDAQTLLPFVTLNEDLNFLIRLNLNAICKMEKSYQEMSYTFTLSDDVKIFDDLLVNCDLRYIYAENNWLVPYNLRYWVSPILVNIFKLVRTDWPLVYLTGKELAPLLRHMDPVFAFKYPEALIIKSRESTIDLVVEWQGIRYYLVNFYVTSFVLGAGGFWLLSSWVCVLSSLLFQSYFKGTDEEEKTVKVKMEGTKAKETKDVKTE